MNYDNLAVIYIIILVAVVITVAAIFHPVEVAVSIALISPFFILLELERRRKSAQKAR